MTRMFVPFGGIIDCVAPSAFSVVHNHNRLILQSRMHNRCTRVILVNENQMSKIIKQRF